MLDEHTIWQISLWLAGRIGSDVLNKRSRAKTKREPQALPATGRRTRERRAADSGDLSLVGGGGDSRVAYLKSAVGEAN